MSFRHLVYSSDEAVKLGILKETIAVGVPNGFMMQCFTIHENRNEFAKGLRHVSFQFQTRPGLPKF